MNEKEPDGKKPTNEEVEEAKKLLVRAGFLVRCVECRHLFTTRSAKEIPKGIACHGCHEWYYNYQVFQEKGGDKQ